MNSFFGIGLAELVLILLLAGLLLGPQHIRQISHKLGLFVAKLQKMFLQTRRDLEQELNVIDTQEMQETIGELRELQEQIRDLQQQVYSMTKPSNFYRPGGLGNGPYANKPSLFPEGGQEWAKLPEDEAPIPSIAPPEKGNLPNLVHVPEDPDSQE